MRLSSTSIPAPTQMKEEDHLSELDGLLASTSRQLLRERLHSCREHIEGLLRARQASLNSPGDAASPNLGSRGPTLAELQDTLTSHPTLYKTIDSYEWDQTSKFLKLYLTLPELTADDHNKVTCSFSDRGVDLRLKDVAGNNFKLVEEYLSHRIKPKNSRFKLQDGAMVLFLAKDDPKLTWGAASTASAYRQAVALDHYGRTELKMILSEYYRIKATAVYQTSEYLLEASIREFMTLQGYYDVFDDASARTAMASFAQSPPKAVVVNFSRVEKNKSTKKLLTELVTGVAAAPDCKLFLTCLNFLRPDEHPIYSHLLDLILKGSCEPVSFCGRISLSDVGRLPATLYQLGIGVRDAEDAATLAKMTLPKHLQTFGVCISRKVKPEDLKPLPKVKHPIQIFFYGVTIKDIVWVVTCVDKMMGLRTCWLNFVNCQLHPSAIFELLGRFFQKSCPLQFGYQLFAHFASMGLPRHSIPPQFQNPPTQIGAPLLGQPPFLPGPRACGVLGIAFDSPHLSPESKLSVKTNSRILGCQLKWAVEWITVE